MQLLQMERKLSQLRRLKISNLSEGFDGTEIAYLSRNDWTGTFPTETLKLALTEKLIENCRMYSMIRQDYEEMEMPTLAQKMVWNW